MKNADEDIPWFEYEKCEEPKDEAELSRCIFRTVDDIERGQPYVLDNMLAAYKKYLGYTPAAMQWSGIKPVYSREMPKETKSIIRVGADTGTSLIAKNMPKATPQTDAADIRLQRVASQLDTFLIGAFYAAGVYQQFPEAFRDDSITGTGTVAFMPKGSGKDFRVIAKRIHPCEVVVPESQCLSNAEDYTDRYRVTQQSVRSLTKKYGKTVLTNSDYTLHQRGILASGTVWVIEAIHICDDIRRKVVVAPGVVLEDIEWPWTFFPYVDLWWSLPVSGFYGDGIATRQYAKQARLDYLNQHVHKALNDHLTTKVFNGPMASPVIHKIGGFAEAVVGRSDPKFIQTPPPDPEVYRAIEDLFIAGMAEEGISINTASNTLPPGVDSAPAQQEYSFKESQRFSMQALRYEQAIAVKTAQILIGMYQHAAMASGDPARVTVLGSDFAKVVDWPDLDMENDVFHLRIGASSIESMSPAGRLQQAHNLLQMQMIGPLEARQLAAHPDIKYMDALALAARRYCDVFAHKLLEGEVPAVDPDVDLSALSRVLHETYCKVAAIDLRESTEETRTVLMNVRDRIAEVDRITEERLAQAKARMLANDPGIVPQPQPQPQPEPAGPPEALTALP